MPSGKFVNYLKSIDILEAREELRMIRIMQYPHTKSEYQRKYQRDVQKIAYPKELAGVEKQKTYTTREAFEILVGKRKR